MASSFGGFGKGLITFLRDLEKNNDRDWFQANKKRFEQDVREPTLAFVAAMGPRIAKISPHILADDRKVGGSMMRLNRDTRFSKDKSPYKTNVAMQFRHAAGKGDVAPGFFLGISTKGVTLGTGIFHPETALANRIRAHIDENQRAWKAAVGDKKFAKTWGGLDGDSLKRPPRGFDQDHPLVEDLKRKDFVSFCEMRVSAVTKKDFIDRAARSYADSKKLLAFLADAVGVAF